MVPASRAGPPGSWIKITTTRNQGFTESKLLGEKAA